MTVRGDPVGCRGDPAENGVEIGPDGRGAPDKPGSGDDARPPDLFRKVMGVPSANTGTDRIGPVGSGLGRDPVTKQ